MTTATDYDGTADGAAASPIAVAELAALQDRLARDFSVEAARAIEHHGF